MIDSLKIRENRLAELTGETKPEGNFIKLWKYPL